MTKSSFLKLVFLFALILFLPPSPAHARAFVKDVSGDVRVTVQKKERAVRKGEELPKGAVVKTGADGRVKLLLPDGSTALVRPNSAARVEKSGSSNAAISLEKGLGEFTASPLRWKNEVFEVTTPVTTAGVRGTKFLVGVPASGEALVIVEEGKVATPGTTLGPGDAGAVTLEAAEKTLREAATSTPFDQWTAWKNDRNARLEKNRGEAAKAIGELLKGALGARLRAAGANVRTALEVLGALGKKETGADDREKFVAKVLRIVEVLRTGAERVREVWRTDREAELRESHLRSLIAGNGLRPGEKIAANWALGAAGKNRSAREKHLAEADKADANIGAALAFLTAAAATDPAGDRNVARLVEEGLGIPLKGEPLAKSPVINWNDLGLEHGANWKTARTIRGKEDFRVEVAMSVERSGDILTLQRTPEAFDRAVSLRLRQNGDEVFLDGIDGFSKKEQAGLEKFLPLLLYRFPLKKGDAWRAWEQFPGKKRGLFIERRVVEAERIRILAGEFETVRIETRLKNDAKLNLLLNVEWIAPGKGQVREMAFRGELASVEWDERM